MSLKLILDSTTDIFEDMADRCEIIPLSVFFVETEYLDGIDLSRDDFYTKLVNSKKLPRTSQPSPAAFDKVFSRVTAQGDEAIVITVSAKFSGTYQSACIAAEQYENIHVIDGKSVAIGTAILAKYALSLMDEGKSANEVLEAVERKKEKVTILACLDTLTYLQKGGRISKTVSVAGNMLSIKPVITVYNGEISLLGKARGSKKANNFLNDEVKRTGVDYSMPILLGYTGVSDEMLNTYIQDSRHLWVDKVDRLYASQIGTVVGTHAGPGAVAVAFFGENL